MQFLIQSFGRKVGTTWVASDTKLNPAINLLSKVSHPNHVWRSDKIEVKVQTERSSRLHFLIQIGEAWDPLGTPGITDLRLFPPIPHRNSNKWR